MSSIILFFMSILNLFLSVYALVNAILVGRAINKLKNMTNVPVLYVHEKPLSDEEMQKLQDQFKRCLTD